MSTLRRRVVFVAQGVTASCILYGLVGGLSVSLLAIAVGSGITCTAALLDRHFLWVPRVLLALTATWVAMVGASALLVLDGGSPKQHPQLGLRGMYIRDPLVGYRLRPHWNGVYDDGLVSARYKINSAGHRDDETRCEPISRIILAGDSFAFGALLDQAETIDKHVELASGGRLDAYNLGVMGYGPPAILETLRRFDEVEAKHVFYLFFNNDLRHDNLTPDNGCTVRRGYLVRIRDFDGTRLSRTHVRSLIQQATRRQPHRGAVAIATAAPLFARLREPLAALYRDTRVALIGEAALFSGPLVGFSVDNVERAAGYAGQMRDLVLSRDAGFSVVIIPTKAEAREGKYSPGSSTFIAELVKRQIDTIEMLRAVSGRDYFNHDDHFNASGARRTATAILEAFAARQKTHHAPLALVMETPNGQ